MLEQKQNLKIEWVLTSLVCIKLELFFGGVFSMFFSQKVKKIFVFQPTQLWGKTETPKMLRFSNFFLVPTFTRLERSKPKRILKKLAQECSLDGEKSVRFSYLNSFEQNSWSKKKKITWGQTLELQFSENIIYPSETQKLRESASWQNYKF